MDILEKRRIIYATLFGQKGIEVNRESFKEAIESYAPRERVDPFLLRVLLAVESSGKPRLEDGRLKILFEGHIFWRELKAAGLNPMLFAAGRETILYPTWNKAFYLSGSAEYGRLKAAIDLSGLEGAGFSCALAAASWGGFQLMGFNFSACGFSSVEDFVLSLMKGEAAELEALVKFLQANALLDVLKSHDWVNFARRYNGPKHALNHYAEKLASAYDDQLSSFLNNSKIQC